jgi:hypothetical protein
MSYRTNNAFDPDDSPDPNDDLAINAMSADAAEEALEAAIPKAWDDDLPRNAKTGTLLNTFRVLCVILRDSPEFKGRFWWSEMLLRPMIDQEPITQAMTGRLREQIEQKHAIQPTPANMQAAIITVARETPRHEAKEWLLSLPPWDGKKRLVLVPKEFLGTEDTLAPRLFARFCISAVARVFDPGCKADCALVITGDQGLKKSTFFEILAGRFFSDADIDIQNKDSVLQLYRSWITEWSEIERVTSRKAADVVKAWLSRKTDFVRLPYGSSVEDFPRTSVIVGTTNKPEFLNDETGDRRFWVIEAFKEVDPKAFLGWRDQLWAEAIAAYRSGERWWLTKEEDQRRDQTAKNFREADPWEPAVQMWLMKNPQLDFVTTAEVLTQAIGMKTSEIRRDHESRVGMVMRALEWERYRPRSGNLDRKRGYRKKCSPPPSPPRLAGPTGPTTDQPPVQPTSPHKIHGGPTGPTLNARVYRGDSASIGNSIGASSPIHVQSQWTGWTGLDQSDNTEEFRSIPGRAPVDHVGPPAPPATIDPLDLTDFLGDCAIVSRTGSELATVVVSLHGEWARLHQRPQLSNVGLMHALIERGFTLAEDRVYGLEVRDSWIDTLNAAEAAMERAAIVAESAEPAEQGAL